MQVCKRFLALNFFTAMLVMLAGSWAAQAQTEAQRYQERKQESNQSTVTLMAAGITGTYAPIAQDIQSIVDEPDKIDGMRVLPILGRGGGHNVLDVLFLRGIDMGITQQEHLEFFKRRDPVLHANIYNRVQYITKLYNSEYHLLVPKSITNLSELEGKKVNFYNEFSATDIAGVTIFDILGIKVVPTYFDLEDSIQKIRDGEVAGATYLAGAPVSGFTTLVKPEDNMHFLPLSPETLPPGGFDKLLQVFLPATLTHETYPELVPEGQTVSTVASGAVLAVYNWPEASDRYRRIAQFIEAFFSKFDEFLKPPRHPKWKEINLAVNVPGWTRFKAAQQWLDRRKVASSAQVKTAFEHFLQGKPADAAAPTSEQRAKLFSEFLAWWQTQAQNPAAQNPAAQ